MDHPQNPRMQELLRLQRERQIRLDAVKAKTDLRADMPLFDVRYRFAQDTECDRIQAALAALPRDDAGAFDPAMLSDVQPVDPAAHHGLAWLVFLDADDAHRGIFLCGAADDIARDYKNWADISKRLLLLLGDWKHILILDGADSAVQALLPD